MRWRLTAAGALGAVVALAVPGVPAGADVTAPDAVGWWTRRPGATPRGDGGFELAVGLQGAESVAAVRATVPDGAVAVRVVVDEVAGAVPADVAFHACPAASPWEAADAGAWDARPVGDCDAGRVDAARAGPGRWAVDVTTLTATGTVDVVLLPSPPEAVSGLGSFVGFTAAFTGTQVVADVGTTSTPPARPPAPVGSGATAAGAAPRPSAVGAVPVARTPVPSAPPTTLAPATGPSTVGTSATGATVPAPMFELTGRDDDRPWGRLLLLVPLSALAGIAGAAARNVARARGLTTAT